MRTQLIHAVIREIFLTNATLAEIFGGRLANIRLPAGTYRPYCVLKVKHTNHEIYTGGEIADYLLDFHIYTTQGTPAYVVQEAMDSIISFMSNFNVSGAKTIHALPEGGSDEVTEEMDLGDDVLVTSMSWTLKMYEPNRFSGGY